MNKLLRTGINEFFHIKQEHNDFAAHSIQRWHTVLYSFASAPSMDQMELCDIFLYSLNREIKEEVQKFPLRSYREVLEVALRIGQVAIDSGRKTYGTNGRLITPTQSNTPLGNNQQGPKILNNNRQGWSADGSNSGDAYISFGGENILADFTVIPELENAQIQGFDTQFCCTVGDNRPPAKKSHKADREKLRREKINEQFAELAAALDPDRPKNDKASILTESTQIVKELRSQLKRLQNEHSSLLNESRELTEEKNEIREEKAFLKNETDKLQDQVQQHLRTLSSWMMMDPAVMMTAASFPYPLPVPQAAPVSSPNCQQPFASSQAQGPLVAPSPYVPLAAVGAFPVHPVLHAYAFPTYGPSVNSHSHVERPYAQYPSQLHPMPQYIAQMQPHQDSQPTVSSSGPADCQPRTSVANSSPLQNQTQSNIVNSSDLQTEEVGKHAISPTDVAVEEHRESNTNAVSCNSETLPNDMNQELLSSSSSPCTEVHCGSNAQVTDLKGEDKPIIEQGTREQIREVTSEEGIRVAE
ncbi:hypothetical protein KI387_032190, partial [Taxus chinensis]